MEQFNRIVGYVKSLGYAKDDNIIEFEVHECMDRCRHYMNNSEFPIAGERTLAKLIVENSEIPSGGVQAIKEGDTSITFMDTAGVERVLFGMKTILNKYRKPAILGRL